MKKTKIFNACTKKRRQPKGFSLVELLVVIAILGILGAVVAPRIFGNVDKAKQKAALSDIKALELAAATAYLDGVPLNNIYDLNNYIKGGVKKDPYGKDYVLVMDEYGEPKVICTSLESGSSSGTSTVIPDSLGR